MKTRTIYFGKERIKIKKRNKEEGVSWGGSGQKGEKKIEENYG